MFSDLVWVAGQRAEFGIDDRLPGAAAGAKIPINVHADEFNELMGDEFIPMVNKGGGAERAGDRVHPDPLATSRLASAAAEAGTVVGNFNNLFMLRCRDRHR